MGLRQHGCFLSRAPFLDRVVAGCAFAIVGMLAALTAWTFSL